MPWYVLHTKPRNEKKITTLLQNKGIHVYCPLREEIRQWSDRRKKVAEPVFKSYVFVYLNDYKEENTKVLMTQGAVRFLWWLGKPGIVREEEIKDVVAYLREEYDDLVAEELKTPDGNIVGAQNISGNGGNVSDANFSSEDEKYEQAKEIVIQTGKTSISNLQVRLGTGYARSAKLINMLEQAGVIVTVTDNSGKQVKVVAGQTKTSPKLDEKVSNTREDILKIEEKQEDEEDEIGDNKEEAEQKETKQETNSFFRF